MLGSRSIWHEGWKAVTTHPCIAGWGNFNDDEWELYNTDVDRSEVDNLADEHPDKVRELVNVWFSEAGRNGAFPLDDRLPVEILTHPRPQLAAPRNRYVYFPDTAPVSEWQAVNTRNRSFVIGALVDIPAPGAEGVLFAIGSRFGGHALYVKDNRLHYVNNFVGAEEQMVVGTEDLPTGENLILSASFDKEGMEPTCATGTLSLYHGDDKVGEGKIKTQLGAYAIAGSGLYVGRHSGEAVTDDYVFLRDAAVFAGRHPAPGRIFREILRVHRRHQSRAVHFVRCRRAHQRGRRLLLSSDRKGHVFRRASPPGRSHAHGVAHGACGSRSVQYPLLRLSGTTRQRGDLSREVTVLRHDPEQGLAGFRSEMMPTKDIHAQVDLAGSALR